MACRISVSRWKTAAILRRRWQNGALGNADYGLHYIGLSGTDVTDEVTGLSIGGDLDFDVGVFKSLQFGAASTERSKVRKTIENDTNGGSCQYCNRYDVTFASLGANVARPLSLPNFMRNAAVAIRRASCRSTSTTI